MSEVRDLVGAPRPRRARRGRGAADRAAHAPRPPRWSPTRPGGCTSPVGPGRRFPFPVPERLVHRRPQRRARPGRGAGRSTTSAATSCCTAPRRASRGCVDAHCPHLGAHLAVGGRVEGDCIRARSTGGASTATSGACVDIPYGGGTRIPSRARVRAYPTIERNQMIWAWYHAEDGEPFYDVPEVDEFADPEWSPIEVREFDDRRRRPGHGREQRRLLPLQVRARHRRHPRGRVLRRRHLQAGGRHGRQLRARGLRARARRAAGQGLRDLPVVDHAHRRGARPRALDLHRTAGQRRGALPPARPTRSAPA